MDGHLTGRSSLNMTFFLLLARALFVVNVFIFLTWLFLFSRPPVSRLTSNNLPIFYSSFLETFSVLANGSSATPSPPCAPAPLIPHFLPSSSLVQLFHLLRYDAHVRRGRHSQVDYVISFVIFYSCLACFEPQELENSEVGYIL